MEDGQSNARRQSGIPRLSRLPMPRATGTVSSAAAAPTASQSAIPSSTSTSSISRPSLRTAASRESLSGHIPKQRLRPTPSRDHLGRTKPATAAVAGLSSTQRPTPSASLPKQTRNVSGGPGRVSRPSTSSDTSALGSDRPALPDTTLPSEPNAAIGDSDHVIIKRSTTLTRRPSEAYGPAPFANQHPPQQQPLPSSNTNSVSSTSPVDVGSWLNNENGNAGGGGGSDATKPKPLKARPSLSERTIETLSQIPSSPALSKKTSSFFDADDTRRPRPRTGSNSSRPGSSYTSDGSMRPPSRARSRPSSSCGMDDGGSISNFRASTNTFRQPLSTIDGTPSPRVSGLASLRSSSKPRGIVRATPSRPAPKFSASTSTARHTLNRSPSPAKMSTSTPSGPKVGSKTLSARPLKPRASVNGLFKKPSIPALDRASGAASPVADSPSKLRTKPSILRLTRPTKSVASTPAKKSINSEDVDAAAPDSASRKSSAALREQIAQAKAAKRAATAAAAVRPPDDPEPADPSTHLGVGVQDGLQARGPPPKSPIVPVDDGFDFGIAVTHDPFNTRRTENAKQKIVQQRLGDARSSGRLNIAAMGLKTIPLDVLKMYDSESLGTYDGSWAESVDLTRFVAADNEMEVIDDAIFPDVTAEDLAQDEDSNGNIFAGLQTLDLHGNLLICLPMGLRQLRQLTSLNLSSNRLANNCLEVVSEITSLRDLKLSNNLLYGPLDPCISKLVGLEILDLHGNNVSSLPITIGNMERLRILNIEDNSFECLPFSGLARLPLTELLAKKNKLSGVLIEDEATALPKLQSLDVSCNQLTHLVSPGTTISLPVLYQLSMSMNRIKALPDVTLWTSLLIMTADENSLSTFPDGFLSLEKIRHVDFSANDIRIIPPEIARMDSLSMLRLSGNPLRDKKFISVTTDELKDMLAARLEPPPPYHDVTGGNEDILSGHNRGASTREKSVAVAADDADQDDRSDLDDFATPPTSAPHSPARSRSHTLSNQVWPVKQGGLLDRSNTQSSALHPVICSKVASSSKVYEVQLHHNLFTTFPESLSFFAETMTALSLANNKLVGETYLPEELELPALQELNLMSNHITSLVPLTTNLRSPKLTKVDVSMNRITTLPSDLREVFPQLAVLLAANNHLMDLEPDTIKGMQVVDAGNNDISHLNPKLGLLGGNGGLKRLEVAGNRFRVPRWSVLERGTDATLRWLRGRVPVAEMAAWRESQGGDANGLSDSDVD